GINQEVYEKAVSYLKSELKASDDHKVGLDWLIDKTEEFCKDSEMFNAISKSVELLEDSNSKGGRGKIAEYVKEALSIAFDPNVGHDYLDDADSRFEHYTSKDVKIPLGLEMF